MRGYSDYYNFQNIVIKCMLPVSHRFRSRDLVGLHCHLSLVQLPYHHHL